MALAQCAPSLPTCPPLLTAHLLPLLHAVLDALRAADADPQGTGTLDAAHAALRALVGVLTGPGQGGEVVAVVLSRTHSQGLERLHGMGE